MFADNPDFYPTPRSIARRMLSRLTNQDAKYFLEPSAGKGDLADVIRQPCTLEEFDAERPEQAERDRNHGYYGRGRDMDRRNRVSIDVLESYPALVSVLRGKEYDVVGTDWLNYDGVSYYDAIVMNPPFSEGAKHLLKAWDFLHDGEIVCLLNEETIKNPCNAERGRLAEIVKEFGDVEFLGDCFSTSERRTGVNVAMVYLRKTAPDDTQDMWARAPAPEKHAGVEYDGDINMLAIRDNLGNMEHWFNMANSHWMQGIQHIRKAKLYMDQNKISDRHGEESIEKILLLALSNTHTCRAEFLRSHRRKAWTSVFEQMEFHRWLDSKQQERFMRDVKRDATIPFTADNIRDTLDNVFMSRSKLFDESVARVFDELCGHSFENGSGPVMPETLKNHWRTGEGWKTNDSYKVNKKLIFPHGVRYDDHSGFRTSYDSGATIYSDLDRILCVLDGKPLAKCHTVGGALEMRTRNLGKRVILGGAEFESEYFEGRFFKKGTVHLIWKRDDLWERFNITAAAGKKWLGQDTRPPRPKKHDPKEAWRCEGRAHNYVNGVCDRCDNPEVDEVAAVQCELCRAVFEYTGEKHCPLHEQRPIALPPSYCSSCDNAPCICEVDSSEQAAYRCAPGLPAGSCDDYNGIIRPDALCEHCGYAFGQHEVETITQLNLLWQRFVRHREGVL